MNELIQYFQALEARLAAQDAKIAALEQRLAEKDQRLADMNDNLNSVLQVLPALSENIESIKQMLKEGVQVTAEPDVEVELVYHEDEEATVELPQEAPAAEPEPASQPEPVAEPEPQPEQVVEQPAPEPVVEQPQPEPVAEQPQPESVAEQPKPEAPRAPQQTSLFGTPVTDIRQAVSIGDRFLFQRELFGGNAEKLQQTLTELNNLHSLDEAVALVDKFGWDKQSPTYELFLNVLRRRFQ